MRRALLLLLAIALAGCGGSGDSGKRLTREQYAAKADGICGKYKHETDSLDRPANLSELAKVADQILPILDGARGELRKLNPPRDEQAIAEEWLGQFDVIVDDVRRIGERAKENDTAGIQALAPPALQHNQRANQLATQLGMTTCAED